MYIYINTYIYINVYEYIHLNWDLSVISQTRDKIFGEFTFGKLSTECFKKHHHWLGKIKANPNRNPFPNEQIMWDHTSSCGWAAGRMFPLSCGSWTLKPRIGSLEAAQQTWKMENYWNKKNGSLYKKNTNLIRTEYPVIGKK